MGCPELPIEYWFSLNRATHFEKPLSGLKIGFQEGPIGNRVMSTSTETGTSITRNYTSNSLNQYTAIDNPTAAPTYDFDGTCRRRTGCVIPEKRMNKDDPGSLRMSGPSEGEGLKII
jgi:hypothetical protein